MYNNIMFCIIDSLREKMSVLTYDITVGGKSSDASVTMLYLAW